MSLVSIDAQQTCIQYMDCDPRHKFSKTYHFECTCDESPKASWIFFEKAHIFSTPPYDQFLSFHPKHLTVTIIHHYNISLSKPFVNFSHSLSQKPLCILTYLPSDTQKLPKTLKMAKKQNQPWDVQATPDFWNNTPSASSEDDSPVQINRLAPVTILAMKVTMKDKEPGVHIKHLFDIISLENAGYAIKAYLMLCDIHHFFEDHKMVVPELIREFWRAAKIYRNEDSGGYFAGKVLGIPMKLPVKTITQAIGCEHHETKFMNNWGYELEDHIGNSVWGPYLAKTPRWYGTLLSKAKIF